MATDQKEIELEIAHVLFIDIVGYSRLLITEQGESIAKLTALVRDTEAFRRADASGKLVRISTGDGMALVFRGSPDAPVRCAVELSRGLRAEPTLRVRMGIHSGPVNEVTDVNERTNVTGAGINIAQRVMDCGDAGHILLSKHVADDLEGYPQWRPFLHELGPCEVKHGVNLNLVNLYGEGIGNAAIPGKVGPRSRKAVTYTLGLGFLVIAIAFSALLYSRFARTKSYNETRSAPPSSASPGIPSKSIAVLPFDNLSEDKANAFFADGVQDEILTDLSRIADLKVISRSSVMHYKSGVERNLGTISQELGVAHVVEGSVQRAGNRVRVNAQLIDARNDAHLWAQTYDRDLSDVFAIQSEIAKTIADQLQAKLSPQEKSAIERAPTNDITAFDLYTRARNLWLTSWASSTGKGDLLQAADLLNQAVAHDPSFFDGYCQLAVTEGSLYFLGWDHTPARLAKAEAAVQAAVRLRPDAGETHLTRARILYAGYLDYDGALAELELARRTIPNDPWVAVSKGYIERRKGRWEESVRDQERAIELDPRNVLTIQQVGGTYQYLRRYPEAKAAYARILAFEPNDAVTLANSAFVDLDWKADTRPLHQVIDSLRASSAAAVREIANYWLVCAIAERDAAATRTALDAMGKNPITTLGASDNMNFPRTFIEGVIARLMHDEAKTREAFTAARAEQEKAIQAQPNYGPAMCVLGLIDAALGRKEEALREGRRAVELLPIEKDALGGSSMVKHLAMIATWVGEKDLALQQLGIATSHHGDLSYGQLKLLPFWDPLRGDPRFEQIVASLAPKE